MHFCSNTKLHIQLPEAIKVVPLPARHCRRVAHGCAGVHAPFVMSVQTHASLDPGCPPASADVCDAVAILMYSQAPMRRVL